MDSVVVGGMKVSALADMGDGVLVAEEVGDGGVVLEVVVAEAEEDLVEGWIGGRLLG